MHNYGDFFVIDEPAYIGGWFGSSRSAVDIDEVTRSVVTSPSSDDRPLTGQNDHLHETTATHRREWRRFGRHLATVVTAARQSYAAQMDSFRIWFCSLYTNCISFCFSVFYLQQNHYLPNDV